MVNDIIADFTELHGPEEYFILFTWDSTRGLSEGYFNGQPLRIPGCKFEPWQVAETAQTVTVGAGRLTIKNLNINAQYTPPDEAAGGSSAKISQTAHELAGSTAAPCAHSGDRDAK